MESVQAPCVCDGDSFIGRHFSAHLQKCPTSLSFAGCQSATHKQDSVLSILASIKLPPCPGLTEPPSLTSLAACGNDNDVLHSFMQIRRQQTKQLIQWIIPNTLD